MFTGLIEQCGELVAHTVGTFGHRLRVRVSFEQVLAGESIAVNGVCLTALDHVDGHVQFDVSPETLRVTNLGQLQLGDGVNLERALSASARLGGHYVSGHVDTTAVLQASVVVGDFVELTMGGLSHAARQYVLPKGSIALNGVSLTINAVNEDTISVMLVPHTLLHTTFGTLPLGTILNVEFDYITRIVAHQLGSLLDSTILSSLIQSVKDVRVEA